MLKALNNCLPALMSKAPELLALYKCSIIITMMPYLVPFMQTGILLYYNPKLSLRHSDLLVRNLWTMAPRTQGTELITKPSRPTIQSCLL